MARPKAYTTPRIMTALRLDPVLHERLHTAAEDRDVSVNWLACRLLERGLEALPSAEESLLTRDGRDED